MGARIQPYSLSGFTAVVEDGMTEETLVSLRTLEQMSGSVRRLESSVSNVLPNHGPSVMVRDLIRELSEELRDAIALLREQLEEPVQNASLRRAATDMTLGRCLNLEDAIDDLLDAPPISLADDDRTTIAEGKLRLGGNRKSLAQAAGRRPKISRAESIARQSAGSVPAPLRDLLGAAFADSDQD